MKNKVVLFQTKGFIVTANVFDWLRCVSLMWFFSWSILSVIGWLTLVFNTQLFNLLLWELKIMTAALATVMVIEFSLILHEIAHGIAAIFFGCKWKKICLCNENMGKHIELSFHVGRPKKIPFLPAKIQKLRNRLRLIGLAGPLTTLIIGILLILPLIFDKAMPIFYLAGAVNVFLGISNLIPGKRRINDGTLIFKA